MNAYVCEQRATALLQADKKKSRRGDRMKKRIGAKNLAFDRIKKLMNLDGETFRKKILGKPELMSLTCDSYALMARFKARVVTYYKQK